MSKRIIITHVTLKNNKTYLMYAEYDEKDMTFVRMTDLTDTPVLNNIYIGRVSGISKNLEAAFVEINKETACFYPMRQQQKPVFTQKQGNKALCIGDEMIVQVTKESMKTKPPVVSSNLNLTGDYLVLTTENTRLGISRKLKPEEKERMERLFTPHMSEAYGIVVRTNAVNVSDDILLSELDQLHAEYQRMLETAPHKTTYSLLRKAEPEYMTWVKGLNMEETDKITTDIPEVYDTLCDFFRKRNEPHADKLVHYQDAMVSLATVYSVSHQLDRAISTRVWLPSGAYLLIEPTEALTVIDVNTGKNVTKKSREDMIFQVNLEAAREIARQLILRNLSGIILVDFIDMTSKEHQETLLKELKRTLKADKVPCTLVDMTKLGLVELTRKKVQKSLSEQIGSRER